MWANLVQQFGLPFIVFILACLAVVIGWILWAVLQPRNISSRSKQLLFRYIAFFLIFVAVAYAVFILGRSPSQSAPSAIPAPATPISSASLPSRPSKPANPPAKQSPANSIVPIPSKSPVPPKPTITLDKVIDVVDTDGFHFADLKLSKSGDRVVCTFTMTNEQEDRILSFNTSQAAYVHDDLGNVYSAERDAFRVANHGSRGDQLAVHTFISLVPVPITLVFLDIDPKARIFRRLYFYYDFYQPIGYSKHRQVMFCNVPLIGVN